MKYGFLAYDMGPSKYNRMVADELAKDIGNEIVFVPAQKRGIAPEYGPQLATCNLVVIGPASFETEQEIAILEHVPETVPLVVLEDTPQSCMRPKFKKYASRVKVVIVAMEQSVEGAHGFGYQATKYLGLPQHWKSAYDAMVLGDKIQARARFNKTRIVGRVRKHVPLQTGDTVLSFCCVKNAGTNNRILSYMKIAADDSTVLAFKTRSDEKLDDMERRVRDAILNLSTKTWFLELGDATLTDVLRASDIAVFSGGATDSIACALARFPAIYCTGNEVRADNIRQGLPGDGEWFIPVQKGNLVVDLDGGPNAFCSAVTSLLTEEGREKLRADQEAAFPVPPVVWDTVSKIARFLAKVAADSNNSM